MQYNKIIKGNTEDEVWQQINADFASGQDLLEYAAVIEHGSRKIIIDIDIDLGGGFESGYETTTITAPLHSTPDFKFAIHREHFTDEIGKFFGMEDVEIGYEEFDNKIIIKTNDPARVKEIFSDASVRSQIMELNEFTFGITTHHTGEGEQKEPFLELQVEAGITDPAELRKVYSAFYKVLTVVDEVKTAA